MNKGTTATARVARSQLWLYMIIRAAASVITFLMILVKVLVMTRCTPSISLVIRVMISPWLLVVKKLWGICCRWANMVLRIS